MRIKTWLEKTIFALLLFVAVPGFSAEEDKQSLVILVYGATGKVGTHVVSEALRRGHIVSAVSRDPSRITHRHENLAAVRGDLLDDESIASLTAGKDVVIVSVRGMIGKSKDPENTIQRIAVEKVVNVLRDMGDDATCHDWDAESA